MTWFKRKIKHFYYLTSEERKKLEETEKNAYFKECLTLAERKGTEKAREQYEE